MRLTVRQGEHRIVIPLPLSLMCSPPVLCCASKFRISWKAARGLGAEVRRIRREHPGWVLMEVDASDGTKVMLTV